MIRYLITFKHLSNSTGQVLLHRGHIFYNVLEDQKNLSMCDIIDLVLEEWPDAYETVIDTICRLGQYVDDVLIYD